MTTSQKLSWGVIAGAIIVIGTALFFLVLPKFTQAASPTGATYITGNFAGAVINTANPGPNATSTSILNATSNDYYVSAVKVGCVNVGTSQTAYTGTGLAANGWNITVATSSTPAPANLVGFADVAKTLSLSTSTVDLLVSSSTLLTATSSLAMEWPAGSYMTFFLNATNTALCTVGVDYFGS